MVFERKGFAREMVSNCNIGAPTCTICWVDTDRGAARPKAGKKKKTREAVFFFWFPLRKCGDASSRSGLTDFSPHSNIYLSPFIPWLHYKRFNGAGRIARARVGHMPCHTIPMCPNTSMCSKPSEARIGRVERGACRVDRQGVFWLFVGAGS